MSARRKISPTRVLKGHNAENEAAFHVEAMSWKAQRAQELLLVTDMLTSYHARWQAVRAS